MKAFFAALALFLCLSAHADDLQNRALAGQAGDVVSTAAALTVGKGLIEGNRLGIVAVIGKAVVLKYADSLPPGPERDSLHRSMSAFGWGATVNNTCWVLATVTGGGFGAVCLPLGIATGVADWQITAGMTGATEVDVYQGAQ